MQGNSCNGNVRGSGRVRDDVFLEVPVGNMQAHKRKKDSASRRSGGISSTKAPDSVAKKRPSTSQMIL